MLACSTKRRFVSMAICTKHKASGWLRGLEDQCLEQDPMGDNRPPVSQYYIIALHHPFLTVHTTLTVQSAHPPGKSVPLPPAG